MQQRARQIACEDGHGGHRDDGGDGGHRLHVEGDRHQERHGHGCGEARHCANEQAVEAGANHNEQDEGVEDQLQALHEKIRREHLSPPRTKAAPRGGEPAGALRR